MAIKCKYTICDKLFEEELTPLKAIRKHCLDCSGGSAHEVRMCEIKTCPLWNFRFGKGINSRTLSAEQKSASIERMKHAREALTVN